MQNDIVLDDLNSIFCHNKLSMYSGVRHGGRKSNSTCACTGTHNLLSGQTATITPIDCLLPRLQKPCSGTLTFIRWAVHYVLKSQAGRRMFGKMRIQLQATTLF